MQPLTEQEMDFSFSAGLLEGVLENAPPSVKDSLKNLIEGVQHYRQKYLDAQQDYSELLEKYNQLTALSAQYLHLVSQQRDQIDDLLIEEQRDLHHNE